MVAKTPATQAAGAGMSVASAAPSSSKLANNTTSTNSTIAATAGSRLTAPLIHRRPASGSAMMGVAVIKGWPSRGNAPAKRTGASTWRSARKCMATALDHIVLLGLESEPEWQAREPIGHGLRDA